MPAVFVHLSDIHFGQEKGSQVVVQDDVKARLLDDLRDFLPTISTDGAKGMYVPGTMASKLLGLREVRMLDAAHLGLVKSRLRGKAIEISLQEIERFHSTYMLYEEVRRTRGSNHRAFGLLMRGGSFKPVATAHQANFWRRSDVEQILASL